MNDTFSIRSSLGSVDNIDTQCRFLWYNGILMAVYVTIGSVLLSSLDNPRIT